MAGPKYDLTQVRAAWEASGGDFAKTQAALGGISRASLYRLLAVIKGTNGGAAGPVAPALPAPGIAPAAAQALGVAVAPAPAVPAPGALLPVAALDGEAPVVSAPAPALEGGAALRRDKAGVFSPVLVPEGPLDLTPYVPPKTGEIIAYRPRKGYLEALKTFLSVGHPTLLVGEAGTGKTSIARYLAHTLILPFLEVSCDALLGFQELFGSVNITEGTSHFIEGLFLKFIQQPCIIILDEVNALDPAKNFKLHQMLQTRELFIKEADRGRGRLYKMHDRCFVILAGNPPTGKYNGVNRWNVALLDRVNVIEFEEFTQEELDGIVPAHAEKEKLLKFYGEARQVIQREGLRTTFSVRSVKDIIGNLSLGFSMRDALLFAFLNKVKQSAGADAFGALFKLANVIWDLEGKKR